MMRIVTFTTGTSDPNILRFPLVRDEDGGFQLVETLAPLRSLRSPVPILLEEAYREDRMDRTGLDLLLRLRMEVGIEASRFPVFVRLYGPLVSHIQEHPRYAVLCTPGVALLTEEQEPSDVEAPAFLAKAEKGDSLLSVLESLPIRHDGDGSRHNLANRWGPVRLWRGLQLLRAEGARSSDDIRPNPEWVGRLERELKGELPYAHLLAMAELRSGGTPGTVDGEAYTAWKSFLSKQSKSGLRVLLLDDEIDHGWGEAVKAVLHKPGTLEVDVSLAGVDFEKERELVAKKIDEGWDLVLADLRTDPADRERVPTRGALHYGGASWIERIKGAHPETAVVAFTASNKAWSVQELRDLGVDGYWVKESPEFGVDDGYSAANAARLLTVVRDALKPRIEARPIWHLTTRLQTMIGASASLGDRDWRQMMIDAPPTSYVTGWSKALSYPVDHVRDRLVAIVGRLRRAYGLSVMNRSSHAEGAFAMHREDLAFLSLWGIINEVGSLYFDGPRHDPNMELWELPSATFSMRDPTTGRRLVYWETEGRMVTVEPDEVPDWCVKDLCPLDSSNSPRWPSLRADTLRIEWLLERAGRDDLADRFAGTGAHERNGLQYLRNHLEDTHGRLETRGTELKDVFHAEVGDVKDICEIWQALLVSPYDEP